MLSSKAHTSEGRRPMTTCRLWVRMFCCFNFSYVESAVWTYFTNCTRVASTLPSGTWSCFFPPRKRSHWDGNRAKKQVARENCKNAFARSELLSHNSCQHWRASNSRCGSYNTLSSSILAILACEARLPVVFCVSWNWIVCFRWYGDWLHRRPCVSCPVFSECRFCRENVFFSNWQVLVLYRMMFFSTVVFQFQQGNECVTVSSQIYAHRTRPSVLIQQFRIQNPSVSNFQTHWLIVSPVGQLRGCSKSLFYHVQHSTAIRLCARPLIANWGIVHCGQQRFTMIMTEKTSSVTHMVDQIWCLDCVSVGRACVTPFWWPNRGVCKNLWGGRLRGWTNPSLLCSNLGSGCQINLTAVNPPPCEQRTETHPAWPTHHTRSETINVLWGCNNEHFLRIVCCFRKRLCQLNWNKLEYLIGSVLKLRAAGLSRFAVCEHFMRKFWDG